MKCQKESYTRREAKRLLEQRNLYKGRTIAGHTYLCPIHKKYHITKQDTISAKAWDLIKQDTQVHQLGHAKSFSKGGINNL